MPDSSPLSLTHDEARARAAMLEVERYDIEVDLRGMLDGPDWVATSTVRFRCHQPGSSTFVDCDADVQRATLNGVDLDVSTCAEGRLPLLDLADHNVLVVSSVQRDTGRGAAILRSVDPSDKQVYVWSSFEPDGARRAWACFDQPDLKAPHRFTVTAPESWVVTSNTAPDSVEDREDGCRVWSFPDTPRLSTYVVVVNAGPFHEIREQRGEHSLGLYCRQSLRRFLERDSTELFRLTEQGLAFFGERFGAPFPQERYDQVFVPDLGGAMENWGCVTWSDTFLHRSRPTHGQREFAATVLLHEMAHQWFGDLVTMRWWDDLWLNEAFASWAATWAAERATDYTDADATILATLELRGYQADMGPGSHPIRSEVADVGAAFANFDEITYEKGQAVLRQLVAYVGEDQFVNGLRAYFRDHAWGNTTLEDLMHAVGAAAGRDLTSWQAGWLDRPGTDTIVLLPDPRSPLGSRQLLTTSADGAEPRPHRLRIGSYRRTGGDPGDPPVELVATTDVETTGPTTPVDLPAADLHLLNDGDLTFAAVRTDEESLEAMLTLAPGLPDAVSRAQAVTTAWDMLAKGELSAGDFLDCVLAVLATERAAGLVEPFFSLALQAAERWSPTALVPRRLARVAELAARRAAETDHRTASLNALARSAALPAHFELLDRESASNLDLAWRVLIRRASLGRFDERAVAALLERDPDPDAAVRAFAVRAALPTVEAKAEAWSRVFEERAVPPGPPLQEMAGAFWRPVQHHLLTPWADRYLDVVTSLRGEGMLATLSLVKTMVPVTASDDWPDRASSAARADGVDPLVRNALLTAADTLGRMLRARS
ncbi:aminopeptidase N [Nocardioides dilutus]